MVKSWPALGFPSMPHGHRVYTSGEASPWGVVVWEIDFESLAEFETTSKEWAATPGSGEQFERFDKLVESRGSTTEFWEVEHVK